MNLVSDLDLPAFDYTAREALAFLAPRSHDLALDGAPQLGGVEGIYGIDKLPIIWSDSSAVSPNHGPGPDVT